MPLVDTHCHLVDTRFDEDREQVIARSLETLDFLVVIGEDAPNARAAIQLTRERVFAAVGFHPYHASRVDDAALEELRRMLRHPRVKAIGEMGLDYYNEFSPRPAQAAAFRKQLDLACELDVPVVIHNREADADLLAVLQPYAGDLAGGILHCFGSDAAFAERCVELGFYISFAGNVTFPKAGKLRAAAAAVPLDRLLLETDAPYLAPQPKRGRRCEPHYVCYTAEVLAQIKGVSVEELGRRTSENAREVYRVP